MAALTERLALLVGLDSKQAVKGLENVGRSAEQNLGLADSKISKTAARYQSAGTGMLIAGGAIAAGFATAVAASMGFDKQLSELEAVASATGSQMDALREQALEAGAATVYSAAEAAQAQTELAKAGLATSDILGGGLTGALDLAAAGSLDLSRAAEIAATTMTTFGLAGEDVGDIADALAAGANKSAASVEDIAMGLQQSGLVAAQFDLTMQETIGVLSLFAQNALRGSDAGTSLKTMLARLNPQTEKARSTMEDLGIDMFDAQGNFIGIAAAAEELKTGLGNLTQEQRNSALQTLFGNDAIRAAQILYENGAAGVEEWTDAVSETGYAGEIAATKLDNLAGDLEALKGSIETALIQTGSGANGALRFLVQGATDAVNAFAGLPGPVQTAGTAIAGIGGAALITAGGLVTMIPKVTQAFDALSGMGTAGGRAAGGIRALGKIGGTAVGIAAAAGALVVLHGALTDAFTDDPPDIQGLTSDLIDFGRTSQIQGLLASEFGNNLSGLSDDLATLRKATSAGFWDTVDQTVLPWQRADIEEAKGSIDSIDKALSDLVTGGNADLAAQIFEQINASLSPDDQIDLDLKLNDYNDALTTAGVEAKIAQPSVDEFGNVVGGTGDDATAAADALDNYKNSIQALTDPVFAAFDAQSSLAEAQQGVTAAADEFGTNSPEWVKAQDDLVRAAFDYEGALLDLKTGLDSGEVSQEDFTAALQRMEDQGFIPVGAAADIAALKFGAVTTAADKLPGPVSIPVTTPGAQTAIDKVTWLDALLGGLPSQVGIRVDASYAGKSYRRAQGGPIYRGFGGPSGTDTVNAWLTPGEFVLQKSAVDRLGIPTLMALNEGYVMGPRMAAGGPVSPARSAGRGTTVVVEMGGREFGRFVVDALGRVEATDGAVRVRTR